MTNKRQTSGNYEVWSGASNRIGSEYDWDLYSHKDDQIIFTGSTQDVIQLVGKANFEADKPFNASIKI